MRDFTGTYYKCRSLGCNHLWDWNDTACPECGSDFSDINIHEELGYAKQELTKAQTKVARIVAIIKSHE